MGHYAAEMACPKCKNCRCTCKVKKDPLLKQFVITNDYKIKKYEDTKYWLNGVEYIPFKWTYKSRKKAEKALIDIIKGEIRKKELEVKQLKERLGELKDDI